jgi:ParB family chromosome partitioning protein
MKNFRSTTSIEWFTPIEYLVAVKSVLGKIELDPASSAVANQTVGALRYFDMETNGLLQEWKGTVFLNPPHNRQNPITPWINKLLEEYHAGNVQEAILLVDASTETQWFSVLYDYPMCFVRGRINFVNGAGHKTSGQIQGSVFVYFGHQQQTFCRVFGRLGRISLPVNISSHT